MRMKEERPVGMRMEETLGLPAGTLAGGGRMELCGNRRVLVEGCRRVLEYEEDRIRLQTRDGVVRLLGRDLCVSRLSEGCALICGTVLSVEFL